MSIMIMSRLFRMNLGGCNRKLLAVRLADFADDEGRGIYPGVKRLASETELSERTIQRILSDFVSEGILVVVKEATGRPGQTTRYDFNLERLFAYAPAKTGDTVSPVGEDARGDNAAERGDTGDGEGCHGVTRTVIEPPIEPSTERECASAGSDGSDDEKGAVRAFKRWYPTWPTFVGDSEPKALKAWMELSADERAEAADRTEAYIAAVKAAGRKYVCSSQVYLTEKRWLKLETIEAAKKTPAAAPAVRGGKIVVPVFGPVWAAARMMPLLDGPVAIDLPADPRQLVVQSYETLARTSQSRALGYVQRLGVGVGDGCLIFPDDFEAADRRRRIMADGYPEAKRLNEAARDARNVTVPAAAERLKEFCEAVPIGSPTWDAWRDHHERMGWPFLPVPAAMKVVYFPKGGPEGLEEFERAARSLLAARDNDDAA